MDSPHAPGEALLGDVEVGHDLDTGDDGALQAVQLRRDIHLVEHAVDAVADAELRLLRLDVDIRRALAVGFRDDPVHELDDGGLFALCANVDLRDRPVEVVHGIAAVLDHLFDCVSADTVELLYGLVDLLARREGDLDGAARCEAKAVAGDGGEGVGGDYGEDSALKLEREDVVLVYGARGELLEDVGARLDVLQLYVVHAQELADLLQEVRLP